MSNRTLIEINHDCAGNIDGDHYRFAQVIYRYLCSASTRGLEDNLERYGLRVIAMRHHSENFRIPERAEGFSSTPSAANGRVKVLEDALKRPVTDEEWSAAYLDMTSLTLGDEETEVDATPNQRGAIITQVLLRRRLAALTSNADN